MAPLMPFVTEEVWQWWHNESIHTSSWPTAAGITANIATRDDSEDLLNTVCEVLSQIRRAKTEAKTSQRTAVTELSISATSSQLRLIEICMQDLRNSGVLCNVATTSHELGEISVRVQLALPEAAT